MLKKIKYFTPAECSTICLKHCNCVNCPLKLSQNRCAYYAIKRDNLKSLSEEEKEREVEI